MKIENSLTFFSMLSHPDRSAIGVRKPVSTSSIRLRPSMPTSYSTLNVSIHDVRSTNWNGSALAASNPAHRTSVIANVTSDTPSAR